MASFSLTKVKVKNARKISSTISKMATGEYNNKAYSLESNLGYKISNNNGLTIIPNIGIRVSQSHDSAYTEKGVGVQNVKIKSKSDLPVVGIVGAKIAKKIQVSENTEITPMIHASIENNFNKKQPKTTAGFVWMGNNYFQSQAKGKKDKLAYNVDASVLVRHKNVELTTSYSAYLQKKYQSHQGQVKLKVSF
ncbi:MAG: autotransporter outer membrane beta-barrel domain-containing protein [Rickettsia endosymbiont of Bryobia graminum]|nr:autotransporter outer membrane beta-barrel domain-containing protein [Rickettsia endosymbiont of Bryobia graminum]